MVAALPRARPQLIWLQAHIYKGFPHCEATMPRDGGQMTAAGSVPVEESPSSTEQGAG